MARNKSLLKKKNTISYVIWYSQNHSKFSTKCVQTLLNRNLNWNSKYIYLLLIYNQNICYLDRNFLKVVFYLIHTVFKSKIHFFISDENLVSQIWYLVKTHVMRHLVFGALNHAREFGKNSCYGVVIEKKNMEVWWEISKTMLRIINNSH